MPKISIIIPVYNVEKYLGECLESVIQQTFKDIEILIINDGSTDKSLQIIQYYISIDNRIKLVQTINQGLGPARNEGIARATGEYIAFIDSDDYIEKNMLESLYNIALKNNSDIVKCRYQRVNEDGSNTSTISKLIVDSSQHNLLQNLISLKHVNVVWINLYTAKLVKKYFFPNIYYEDAAYVFKLYYDAKKISYTNNVFYNWRLRDASISRSISYRHINDIFEVLDITYKFLKEKNIYKKYQTEFIKRCFTYQIRLIENIHKYAKNDKDKLLAHLNVKKISRNYWSEKKLGVLKNKDNDLYLRYIQNSIEYNTYHLLSKNELCAKLYENNINLLKKEIELNSLLSNLQHSQKNLSMAALKKLKNKFKGERCFILGEGASFTKLEPSKLIAEYTFGVSNILNKFIPSFYVSNEQRIIEENKERLSKPNIKYKFIPAHYSNLLENNKSTYPLKIDHGYKQRLHNSYQIPRFSKKITKRIFCGETDIHLCMQLAYYLGFSTIYLLGIELNYTENKLTLYRDTTKIGLQRIFNEFQLAKTVFEKDNREIINLSHQSALKMFKFASPEKAFDKLK